MNEIVKLINRRFILANNDYFIFTAGRRWRRVKGKKIILKGYEEFDFFFYKEKDLFVISESITGCRVSKEETSNLLEVMRKTIDRINEASKNKFLKTVELKFKVTKLSPRYRHIIKEAKRS